MPATAFFGFCVSSLCQRSYNGKALQKILAAKQDGAIGPKTLQVVANYENGETLGRLHDRRQKFYEGLSHFKTFGCGWTQRNKETLEAALSMVG